MDFGHHSAAAIDNGFVGQRTALDIKIDALEVVGIDHLQVGCLQGGLVGEYLGHFLVGGTAERDIHIAAQGTDGADLGPHFQVEILTINLVGGEPAPCGLVGSGGGDETQ